MIKKSSVWLIPGFRVSAFLLVSYFVVVVVFSIFSFFLLPFPSLFC